MNETAYQNKLISKIQSIFQGCYIFINDPQDLQGIPDFLILYKNTWAMLEVKKDATSPYQPNQEYYLEMFGEMSFAAVIYPEIEDEVLYALQQTFGSFG